MSKEKLEDDLVDQNIVEAIKNEYYKQINKQIICSGKSCVNLQLDIAAIKAAKICERIKCDPAVYIAAQHKYLEPLNGFTRILPTQIAGPRAEEFVNLWRSIVNEGNTFDGLYAQQKRYLALAIKNTKRTLEDILLDPAIGFFAWFRCLVTNEPIPSVIKKYGMQAVEEMKNSDLRAFLDGRPLLEGVTFDYSRLPRYD